MYALKSTSEMLEPLKIAHMELNVGDLCTSTVLWEKLRQPCLLILIYKYLFKKRLKRTVASSVKLWRSFVFFFKIISRCQLSFA